MNRDNGRDGRRLLALTLLAFGCAPDHDRPSALNISVTDSAGVQIVHNRDAAVDTSAVNIAEVLRIGEVDGPEEYQFHGVRDIALADDGRMFLSDEGSRTIRIYGRDGRFQKQFGSQGTGPGEFQRIAMPILWRDTIFAFDPGRWQASLFDTTGVLLASFKYGFHGWGTLNFIAATERGWIVMPYEFRRDRRSASIGVAVQDSPRLGLMDPRLVLRSAHFTVADVDSLVRMVVTYPSGRSFGMAAREGNQGPIGVLMNPPLFEPFPNSRVSPRGRIFVARGFPYVVDVFDLDGKHVRSIRRAHQPIPITDAHVDELLKHVNAHYDTIGGREMNLRRRYEKQATFPRVGFLPVTGRMFTDANDAVWVQRTDIVANPVDVEWSRGQLRPTYWDVFDSTGVFRHIVRFPPRFTLRAVRDSFAVGVGRDDLDVQYIVGYMIRKQ